MRGFGLILLVLCIFVESSNGLKILMYQIAFSPSHMPFSGAIADTLIDRGHVVVSFSVFNFQLMFFSGQSNCRFESGCKVGYFRSNLKSMCIF